MVDIYSSSLTSLQSAAVWAGLLFNIWENTLLTSLVLLSATVTAHFWQLKICCRKFDLNIYLLTLQEIHSGADIEFYCTVSSHYIIVIVKRSHTTIINHYLSVEEFRRLLLEKPFPKSFSSLAQLELWLRRKWLQNIGRRLFWVFFFNRRFRYVNMCTVCLITFC